MDPPRLSQSQRRLCEQLFTYNESAKESYLGALYELRQEEHPDRLVHFAQSLREVIDQLARSGLPPEREGPRGEGQRKERLQQVFDPRGQHEYMKPLFDTLASEYSFLSAVAHHNEKLSDKRALETLSRVEGVLNHLTRSHLEINSEIDKLLENPPSAGSAEKIVALHLHPAAQYYLAEKMQVDWLPHVAKAGFFKDPPPASPDMRHWDGWRWPPAVYLQKCAKASSDEVTGVILSCKFERVDHQNPIVYADFLRCAARLPAANMETVAQKALNEDWDRFICWNMFSSQYVKVAELLYVDGRYEVSARMLLRALRLKLSKPRAKVLESDGAAVAIHIAAPIGEHEFEEAVRKMPALARKNPLPAIKLLDNLLRDSIELYGRGPDGGHDDGYRHHAMEALARYHANELRSRLANLLGDCVVRAVRNGKGAEATEILRGGDHRIYRRLELRVYAEFPGEFKREAALSALWYFDFPHARREYLRLLETAFPALPDDIKLEILDRIDAGYGPATLESVKLERGEARAADEEKCWKLKCLECVKEHLDEKRKSAYEDLRKELSEPERPEHASHTDFGAKSAGGFFDGKDTDEVFEAVKEYEPSEHAFWDETAEAFGAYVRDNPLECSQRAPRLATAPRRIQHELFDGLGDVVENNGRIDWNGVLSLIEAVARSGALTPENAWQGLPIAAYPHDPLSPFWLLEKGLKTDSLDFGLRDRVWGIVEDLAKIGMADEDAEYPGKISSLTLSMHSLNGASFRTICHCALWCKRHDGKQTLAPEAKRIFDEYLDGQKHTVFQNAVLGAFLPDFYYLDRGWARRLPGRIRPTEKAKIAFWDGYVSGGRMHPAFDDLWKTYMEFMNGDTARKPELARLHESTIGHVMLAYFYGSEKAGEIVDKFLKKRNPESQKRCIKQIGFILLDNGADPKFDTANLEGLWKHAFFKDCDLSMWFTNTPLDAQTSIRLYRDHVKQCTGDIDAAYNPVYELGKYADKFPSETAECLEALMSRYGSAVPEKARDIFEQLCRSNRGEVGAICQKIYEKAERMGLGWRAPPDV